MIPEDFSRLPNPALNTSETEGTLQLCTPEVNYTGQAMDTGMTNYNRKVYTIQFGFRKEIPIGPQDF